MDWVLYRTAIHPRMQVVGGTLHIDLKGGEPAQANEQGRLIFAMLAAVGTDHHVTDKAVPVGGDKIGQGRAADLLLTLKEEFEIELEGAFALQQRFHGEDRWQHIALIIV